MLTQAANDEPLMPGRASRHREWLAVLLFAAVVLFTRMWEGDLHGDPVHYAAVAKNIVTTGNWLVLQDEPGQLYLRKPPLMFWLVAVNFRLFGANTYAAKFWSCGFAVGVAVMTCLLGRRLFGRTAGLLAGCMVAATPGLVMASTDLRLESAVTFFTVLAVYALVRVHQDERPRWLLAVGLAAGLGMMTKAVCIVHVGVLTLAFLAIWRRRWLFHPYLFGALGLAALLAVPWHAYILTHARDQFAGEYVGREISSRLALGAHFFDNLWKDVSVVVLRALPWSLFAAYGWVRRRSADKTGRWGMALALLWAAEVVVLMAVPAKQRDRYVVPAYPALALVAGYGMSLLLQARIREKLPAYVVRFAVGLGLVLALFPIKLHSYRCRGFSEAKAVLDHAAPGGAVAWYGPDGQPPSWGLRAKAVYYLDRTVAAYADPEEVDRAGVTFLIARDSHIAVLKTRGFEKILALDKDRRLFYRPRSRIRPPDTPARSP